MSVKAVTLSAMHIPQNWKRFGMNLICRSERQPDAGDCRDFKDMDSFDPLPLRMFVKEKAYF